jgi:hypothetical protein
VRRHGAPRGLAGHALWFAERALTVVRRHRVQAIDAAVTRADAAALEFRERLLHAELQFPGVQQPQVSRLRPLGNDEAACGTDQLQLISLRM